MKIYVAAPFARASYADTMATRLSAFGHKITSGWHVEVDGPENLPALSISERQAIAATNDRDVVSADVVVAFVFPGEGKEMYCECAFARMLGKPVVWVGDEARMPLSAFRAGAMVCTSTERLMGVFSELTGGDGIDRLRIAVHQF